MGYVDSLIRFLSRVTGNIEDAKEIAQDVFATLWERRAELDPHTSLHGFVYGMARNMAFRVLRTRAAGPVKVCEGSVDMLHFAESADEGIITLETSLLLEEVLRGMPAQRRRVFELSRDGGLTYNEIAIKMGISINTVRTHMMLALRELRAVLAFMFLWYIITN